MFFPDWFLRSVYGTPPFLEYCYRRRLDFEQRRPGPRSEDRRRWAEALARLPRDRYARVELELAMVNEMAAPEAVRHLSEAAGSGDLPPEEIPFGAPLALWFLLHRPKLFREVFLHHEADDPEPWHVGRAARDRYLSYLPVRERRLAAALQRWFRAREGIGRFCAVSSYWLRESCCFVAHVADRPRLLDSFTGRGTLATSLFRLALPVVFVYFPADGTVLLRSHVRARDRTAELFELFGAAALGAPVTPAGPAFDLELLKRPFHPLPDAGDMKEVRVRALHLHYAGRDGRRRVLLETLPGDEPAAIEQLLERHAGDGGIERLRVAYAELQVRLCVDGTSRCYLIRLWPHYSNLGPNPLAARLRACLKRWDLDYVRRT